MWSSMWLPWGAPVPLPRASRTDGAWTSSGRICSNCKLQRVRSRPRLRSALHSPPVAWMSSGRRRGVLARAPSLLGTALRSAEYFLARTWRRCVCLVAGAVAGCVAGVLRGVCDGAECGKGGYPITWPRRHAPELTPAGVCGRHVFEPHTHAHTLRHSCKCKCKCDFGRLTTDCPAHSSTQSPTTKPAQPETQITHQLPYPHGPQDHHRTKRAHTATLATGPHPYHATATTPPSSRMHTPTQQHEAAPSHNPASPNPPHHLSQVWVC